MLHSRVLIITVQFALLQENDCIAARVSDCVNGVYKRQEPQLSKRGRAMLRVI